MPKVNIPLSAEDFAAINSKILNKGTIKIEPKQEIKTDETTDFLTQAGNEALDNAKNISGFKGEDETFDRNSVLTDAKSKLVKNINYLFNNSLTYGTSALSNVSNAFSDDILTGIASVFGTLSDVAGKSWLTGTEKAELMNASFGTLNKRKPEVTVKEFYTKSSYNGIPFEVKNILNKIENIELKQRDYKTIQSYDKNNAINENTKIMEDAIKKRKEIGNIGYLYIKPITDIDGIAPAKIPFEFNPKISEGALQAKYAATSFLSRVGEVQNYTGTSSTTLSISVSYEITSDGTKSSNYTIDSWMNIYTPEYIDKIEAAYRSLVYPYFKEENGSVTYIRPPAVKIILYENEDDISNYDSKMQMEYAYPKGMNSSVFIKSQANKLFKQHKTFVATSVTISKNEENKNFFIKDKVIRYSGFDVEMNLIEVTEDYTDVIPDFITYYNRYKGMK